MRSMHLILWLLVGESIGGPVDRGHKEEALTETGTEILTYKGDIADMENIRRKDKAVKFLQEGDEESATDIDTSHLVS